MAKKNPVTWQLCRPKLGVGGAALLLEAEGLFPSLSGSRQTPLPRSEDRGLHLPAGLPRPEPWLEALLLCPAKCPCDGVLLLHLRPPLKDVGEGWATWVMQGSPCALFFTVVTPAGSLCHEVTFMGYLWSSSVLLTTPADLNYDFIKNKCIL